MAVLDDALDYFPPNPGLEAEAMALMQEFFAAGEGFVHGSCRLDRMPQYAEWLAYYGRVHAGNEAGSPACCTYFVRERKSGRLVGMLDVRHGVDESAYLYGHIGYSVAPGSRGKGYGTAMLRWGLDTAQKLGVPWPVVCCYENNKTSRKVMENNGLLEEKRYTEEHTGLEVLMYRLQGNGIKG